MQSNAEQRGYEVLGQVLQDIAEEEAAQADLWIESELTDYEVAGLKDCTNMAHWRGAQAHDQSGKAIGTRFLPIKHRAHDERVRKARARHDIEFCYNKAGKTRVNLPDVAKIERVAKAKKIKRKMSTLDRRMAAVAARNARFS